MLGMIVCVLKVSARDVDHKKYNSKDPEFYRVILPWNTITFGFHRQCYVAVQAVGDGKYTIVSQENSNSDGISIRITCTTSDLRVMLRKSDGNGSYLSDDDLGLDPVRFFVVEKG